MADGKLTEAVDPEDAYAAFNRGDFETVERFIASTKPPPRPVIERLERRINMGLRYAARPRRVTPAHGNRAAHGKQPHRRARRAVRASAHGPPSREPDDDPADPPARVILAHAARVDDPAVGWWLQRWAEESLGLGDDALWPRWTA